MRSGRMRSALRTSSRMADRAACPPGWRAALPAPPRVRAPGCSSAASSIVTMRSSDGNEVREDIEQRGLARAGAAGDDDVLAMGDAQPQELDHRRHPASRRNEVGIVSGARRNLRIVSAGPFRASGGMIALTRDPSRRRASTIGELSSIRRPSGATMRSMTPSTARSLLNATGCRYRRPARST